MRPWLVSILSLLLCLAPVAAAAEARSPAFSGRVTVYGWLTGVELDASAPLPGGGSLDQGISAGFGDILEVLDFAGMATFELSYGEIGFLGDLFYAKLSSDSIGPRGARLDADLKTVIGTTALTWRAWRDERLFLDLIAGARIISTEVDLGRTGPLATRSARVSSTLVDPIFGLRVGYAATGRLSLRGLADVGGFGAGSELSWEVFGGLGYAVTDNVLGEVGFRYLSVDIEEDGAETEIRLYGPAIGATYRF